MSGEAAVTTVDAQSPCAAEQRATGMPVPVDGALSRTSGGLAPGGGGSRGGRGPEDGGRDERGGVEERAHGLGVDEPERVEEMDDHR